MIKKPLCYAPFIGMYATSYNSYAPCCVSKKFKFIDAEQYWNSNKLKEIRSQLLDGHWPDSCIYCKNKKLNNLQSDVWIWDLDYNSNQLKIDIECGNENLYPLFIDYRPSNVCNLKCRMCGPQSSNQIEKELLDNPQLSEWYSLPNKTNNFYQFLDFIKKCKIKKIKILGGEPTIDENTIEFLKHLTNQNPTLRFTTNGTNLNKKFQDIISKFNKVHISFSVDAVEETYEYIRSNSNWEKTSKQIIHMLKKYNTFIYDFNIVLMPYNIFNLENLISWFYKLYCDGNKFNLYFDNSNIPYTSLSAVLPEDIELLISRIEFLMMDKKHFYNNQIIQLVKLLHNVKFNPLDYNMFKKFNNTLDEIRKTKLIEIDKRFLKYV